MAGDVSSPGDAPGHRDPARAGVPAAPLALYRRYRPATFAELKGQDHVTEPLRQALRSGRVHHAYLFSGPRGCGKTSSARILARSLNCEAGPTPDPCGTCESCIALAPSGPGSIDVIEIDAASHGGIDDARDLRERAFYSPVSARYKIYIIDEAHMVTGGGFNALLKLVEEPPPHLKFVFATTEPEKVIATIRSRTHHYPFRLVPPAVLRELLEEILASEKISYEPAVLPVVIRAGAGSVRDTLSVLDQLIAGADESGLRYDRAIALLGYTDDALLDEMADAFAAGNGAAVFRAIDHVVEAGHDPRRFAMDLLDRLRDLIILAAVPDAAASGLLDVPDDALDRMRTQAAGFGQERLVRAAETINAGLVDMRGATSPRLLLELMCAQVLLPGSAAPARTAEPASSGRPAGLAGRDDLAARIERLERQLSGGSAEQVRSAPARPAAGAGPAPAPGRQPDKTAGVADGPARQDGREASVRQFPAVVREPAGREPAGREPAGREPAGREPAGRAATGRDSAERESAAQAAPDRRPAAATEPGAPSRPGSGGAVLDTATLRSRWPDVLDAVRDVRRTAWILLSSFASVESVEGNVVTLAFDTEGNARGFGSSGSDGYLADVLAGMFGVRPMIKTAVQQPGRGGPADSRRGAARAGSAGGSQEAGDGPETGPGNPDSVGGWPERPAVGGKDRPADQSGQRGQARDDAAGPGPDAGPGPRQQTSEPAASPAGRGLAGDTASADGPARSDRVSGRPGTSGGTGDQDPAAGASGSVAAGGPMGARPPGRGGRAGTVSASGVTQGRSARPADAVIADDPRPFTDAGPDDVRGSVTGSDLILRELGGHLIEEIGED